MHMRNNRRSFLKAGLGAGLLPLGYHSAVAAPPTRSPNEKLHIGAIGVWTRARDNITACANEQIVALADVDAGFLSRMHDLYPNTKTYVDFRKLLEQRDLDAVVISTPDHTHFHAARQAMQSGLHVYCEKPLAHSVREVESLVRTAAACQVVTQHGNQHHASQGYRQAVAILQAETIGKIQAVHSWTARPIWPQGIERPPAAPKPNHLDWDLWLGPAPARPYAQGYHTIHWRGFWDFGTGALGDMGPHLLDPVFTALQLQTPQTIQVESAPVSAESAPEWSIVRFEFSQAQHARQPLTVTWYDGGKRPSAEAIGVRRPPPHGTMLIGERGRLFIPQLGKKPIVLMDDKSTPKIDVEPGLDHHRDWIAACKANTTPRFPFSKAEPIVTTCLLGNIALRIGTQLQWNAQKKAFDDNATANALLDRRYRQGWESA